jgi:Family of unknown function (DUF6084)
MPDLTYKVEGAVPLPFSATPQLGLLLRVTDNDPAPTLIPAVTLRCQIRIEPARRRYEVAEKDRLLDLFGEPSRWGQTLRSLLWTHANVIIPPFTGSIAVELPVPCTFDFNVGATKYFAALEDGEIPLTLLFSGTIFQTDDDGALQVFPIPWEREAEFRLPVKVWREMMDHFYPNTAWLCLRRDVFDRIHELKMRRGIPTWEQAMEFLLSQASTG